MDKKQIETSIEEISKNVKTYPDFPKKGILFYDIFSILGDSKLSQTLYDVSTELIIQHFKEKKLEFNYIAGLESRGFLLGAVLAEKLKVGFIPIRKQNNKASKLPGDIISVGYGTEYSQDAFDLQLNYINKDAKILIVDDLMATGGSVKAAETLINKANATVVGCFCAFEICGLKGRSNLLNLKETDMISVIQLKD